MHTEEDYWWVAYIKLMIEYMCWGACVVVQTHPELIYGPVWWNW